MAVPTGTSPTTSDANTERDDAHHDDGAEAFYSRMAAKFEAEDAASAATEDGIVDDTEDGTEEESGTEHDATSTDDADGTEEDPAAGTSSGTPKRTNGAAKGSDESDESSTDDDESDHTGDASSESEEGGDADAAEEADAEEEEGAGEASEEAEEQEDDVAESTKAVLAGRGADLTVEDIPEEYRGIVTKKLRGIDAAFTRIAQEATAFRRERTQLEAEARFRTENPELVIVEMLRADPELFDKVNAQIEKLDDATQAEAFKIVVKDKRKSAVDAVESAYTEEQRLYDRAVQVENSAKQLAANAKLPWRLAERAVEAALLRKPADARDLTDAELQQVIADEAKAYQRETRETTRAASKAIVKQRTATKAAAAPAAKRPASAASPRPAARRPAPLDHSSEEARQARMLESARRIIPGVKD